MPLNARHHVRKMRGGTQAHLLEAEDGRCYVVKFQNNPQHRRVLVNELIASVFLRYLQLSVPDPAIIGVSEEFLRANPEVFLQVGSRRVAVLPGWHFGCRYPGDPEKLAVYDFLPDTLLSRVANLAEFRAFLAFDKWVANADGRQAVFVHARLRSGLPAATRAGFLALMIDEGFAFDGPNWGFRDSPIQGLYHRPLVYEPVRSWDDFQPWLDRIVHFPEELVDEALKQVPLAWVEDDQAALERLLEMLLARRPRVPDLIDECRRARPEWFPNWR